MAENPGLQFDIKIAGVDAKDVEKLYKEKEATIQKTLDKASTLSLTIKGVDIKNINDQLTRTKKLLDQISQANQKNVIGTPLQRAKADIAFMEASEKAKIRDAAASSNLAIARDREAKSALQVKTQEERLAQAKLRTDAIQKKQISSTQKQTQAWQANKGALNGVPQLLNSYVSILGGVRLFTNIKDITKEFELQRVALRAITQDAEFADQLFERIKATAIASPFSTKDLITYTKQLSAYRIENENLFDTMNQLADVSAGLGVSMERLILAYGQVKAASVLRGQELRQFTEAGIPLVALLADKFTELRGEMTSTSDVFELISARMVPFEMVAEIFDDMTSAGGKFFEMQKIQAESLHGVYENLTDNIQIAFNQLGEENRGILMGLGLGATQVAQNLSQIVTALSTIAGGFAVYKIAAAFATTSTNVLTVAQLRQAATSKAQMLAMASNNKMMWASASSAKLYATAQLKAATATNVATKAFWRFTAAMAKNPIGLVVIAISALVGGLLAATKEARLARKAFDEMATSFSEKIISVENYTQRLKELNEVEADSVDVAEKRAKIIEGLAEVDADYANVIRDKADDTDALNKAESQYVATLRLKLAVEKELLALGTSGVVGDYADARERENRALSEINNNYMKNISIAKEAIANGKSSIEITTALKEFVEGSGEYEDRLDALWKALYGNKKYSQAGSAGFVALDEMYFDFTALEDWAKAANDAKVATDRARATYSKILEETKGNKVIIDSMSAIDDAIAKLGENPSEDAISQATWNLKNNMVKVFKDAFDAKGLTEELQEGFATMFKDMYDFDFKILARPDEMLVGWKQIFRDIGKYTTSEINELGTYGTALDDIVKKYKENADLIDQITPSKDADDPKVRQETITMLTTYNQKQEEIYATLKALNQLHLLNEKASGSASEDAGKAIERELSLLKAMKKEYERLVQFTSKSDALRQIQEIFNPPEGKMFDPDTYIRRLEEIMAKFNAIPDKDKALDLKIEINEETFNGIIEGFEDRLGSIADKIKRKEKAQDFFDKIFELTGDVDLAKNISFNFEGFDFENMRESLIEQIQTILSEVNVDTTIPPIVVDGKVDYVGLRKFIKEIPPEFQDALGQALEQLIDYDAKSLEEIYKTAQKYSEYEIKKTHIISTNTELRRKTYEQDIANIEQVIDAINRAEKQSLLELDWETFKGTEEWSMLFDNLERMSFDSINAMLEDLERFKTAFGDEGVEAVKELISKIKQLREETEKRDPFSAIKGGLKEMKDAMNDIKSSSMTMDAIKKSMEGVFTTEEIEATEAYQRAVEQNIGAQDKYLAAIERVKNGLRASADIMSNYSQALNDIGSLVSDLIGDNEFSAFVSDMAKGFGVLAGVLGVTVTMIGAVEVAAIALGVTVNTLLPWLWVLTAAAAAVGSVIAILNTRNRKLDKQIEIQEKIVRDLAKAYEDLSDAMDKAVGGDKVTATNLLISNLNKQIKKTKELIGLENKKSKRKRDADAIEEWETQISEYQKKIIDASDELVEYFTGTALNTAAESFADSWLNAYVSFENTKEALSESMQDLIKNMVAKAVLAKAVEVALRPVFDMIERSASGGFSVVEINDAIKTAEAIIPGLDAVLTGIMEGIGIKRNGDTNLTGISKDIAGITEQTALALGALGNNLIYQTVGIRGDVAAIRAMMEGGGGASSGITLVQLQAMNAQNVAYLMDIRQNTAETASACRELSTTIRSVTSARGTGSVKVLNTQIV